MTDTKLSHEEVSLVLPWYLNGTLEGEELDAVKSHLAECSKCAHEAEELTFIKSVVTESNEVVNESIEIPVPEMQSNVMDRIGEFEDSRARESLTVADEDTESLWDKVLRFFDGFKLVSPVPAGVATILIIQLMLIIVLASKLYTGGEEQYVVLSGPAETAAEKGPVIIVSFVDTATDREITETLNEIDGRIIDGPNPGGLYVVELAGESVKTEDVDKIIAELKTEKDIINKVFKGQSR